MFILKQQVTSFKTTTVKMKNENDRIISLVDINSPSLELMELMNFTSFLICCKVTEVPATKLLLVLYYQNETVSLSWLIFKIYNLILMLKIWTNQPFESCSVFLFSVIP